MAVHTDPSAGVVGNHVAQFYERDADLIRAAGDYLADGALAGDAAIVIASDAHRRGLADHLSAAGVDIERASDEGLIVWLDAAETLARFADGGAVDRDRFRATVGRVVRQAVATGRPVRAFGEMVALLWDAGEVAAAIELERLWNELGQELPFSLFCAYHATSVRAVGLEDALRDVCDVHGAIIVTTQFPADVDSPRAARQLLRDALSDCGYDEAAIEDAQIVLSELAANAVMHARSPFTLTVECNAGGVRIAVGDASAAQPVLQPRDARRPSGRGLRIVAALARHWDVEPTGDGKVVWAELPVVRAVRFAT